jgi:hypothetical protein
MVHQTLEFIREWPSLATDAPSFPHQSICPSSATTFGENRKSFAISNHLMHPDPKQYDRRNRRCISCRSRTGMFRSARSFACWRRLARGSPAVRGRRLGCRRFPTTTCTASWSAVRPGYARGSVRISQGRSVSAEPNGFHSSRLSGPIRDFPEHLTGAFMIHMKQQASICVDKDR